MEFLRVGAAEKHIILEDLVQWLEGRNPMQQNYIYIYKEKIFLPPSEREALQDTYSFPWRKALNTIPIHGK